MILFVGNNRGFMFIQSIIDIIVNAYKNLRQFLAGRKNQVLGIMLENGDVYCRKDMDKYGITDVDARNITYRNTLTNSYNCIKCGYKITLTNHNIRYEKRHKIGKRGFN